MNAIFDHPAFVWFTKHFFFSLMGIATLDTVLMVVDRSAWVYYDAAIAVICVLLALWLPPKET